MRAQDRKAHNKTKRLKLQPHTKWAKKFIALYQCKLSEREREQLEAHLQKCQACCEGYTFYREVAGMVQSRFLLEAPSELPAALQALKDERLALDAQCSHKIEPEAEKEETLDGVGDAPAQRKRPA
jgi:hypothetical protein